MNLKALPRSVAGQDAPETVRKVSLRAAPRLRLPDAWI
jgi:hypothetical protein